MSEHDVRVRASIDQDSSDYPWTDASRDHHRCVGINHSMFKVFVIERDRRELWRSTPYGSQDFEILLMGRLGFLRMVGSGNHRNYGHCFIGVSEVPGVPSFQSF
ncbi:hypothetical protein PIB30_010610 [Stylosanthes scabra]|uniref:Uncharacterized protein n=1 Tax=Stylosanthes scabra TaxID=79078 RepID=A0ABU6T6J7_9FABA|nr:hypothetical protein [Stylosanthes scabra]